ncbi:MAG: PEP-CTERM sorting domain-containing protein [Symploca sp. SIO3E6]|nr:PEP-CTERM sorting domain-containing protein [Caldora sp. SIO3E6]
MKNLAIATVSAICSLSIFGSQVKAITLNIMSETPLADGTLPGRPTSGIAGGGNLLDVVKAAARFWEFAILDDKQIDFKIGWEDTGERSTAGASFLEKTITFNTYETFNANNTTENFSLFLDDNPFEHDEFEDIQTSSGFENDFRFDTLNTGRFFESVATGDASGRIDLFSTALHEIGHILGLSRSNNDLSGDSLAIESPLPFSGIEIEFVEGTDDDGNPFTDRGHINIDNALLLPSRPVGTRRLISDIDVLAVAQAGNFEQVELPSNEDDFFTSFTFLPNALGDTYLDLNRKGGLDIIPGNGGVPIQPNPVGGNTSTVFAGGESVEFSDSKNRPDNRFFWQTQVMNFNDFTVDFPLNFFFPGDAESISGNLTLEPGAMFGMDIQVQDNPPEIGDWIWSVSSSLGFPIGIDTAITEFLPMGDADGGEPIPDPFDFNSTCTQSEGCQFVLADSIQSTSAALTFGIEPSEPTKSVPEPSTILGLSILSVIGLFSKKKAAITNK